MVRGTNRGTNIYNNDDDKKIMQEQEVDEEDDEDKDLLIIYVLKLKLLKFVLKVVGL